MALTDFFRINMPYGIFRNEKGEWTAFNREYQPLGETDETIKGVEHFPPSRFVKYTGATEAKLMKIAVHEHFVSRDSEGRIYRVYLYNDATNPQSSKGYWDVYFQKIKLLATFERKQE